MQTLFVKKKKNIWVDTLPRKWIVCSSSSCRIFVIATDKLLNTECVYSEQKLFVCFFPPFISFKEFPIYYLILPYYDTILYQLLIERLLPSMLVFYYYANKLIINFTKYSRRPAFSNIPR